MDLNAVRMFVGVVQAGSLSAAAARIRVPLPTLSRRLRQLERDLKVQLLERSVRGTRLTDAGTRLYEHASRGVETLLEGLELIATDQANLRGRLRLSIPPTFEPWWSVLSNFQTLHPNIQLQVYTSERRIDLIEDGIDVALRVGAIVHESMVAKRILSYRHVLVASPILIARLGQPDTPQALHHFPCGVWNTGSDGMSQWRLGKLVIEPQVVLSTNDYAHLYSRALRGDLITELPPFIATRGIEEGRLISLLRDYPMPEQQVNLLYPSHRHPSAIIRAYLDFCQQHAPAALRALGHAPLE